MKLNMKKWIKIILVSASIVALTACSTTKKSDQASVDGANYDNSAVDNLTGAEASGLGQDSSFDDATGRRHSALIYYFDYDSNVVHAQDKGAIASNARYLSSHPRAKVLLEGNTDPRGSREYNIGLGERRARAVEELLTAGGANRTQIRVISYGAQKLASPGHTPADYQQDRRVVLVYLKK